MKTENNQLSEARVVSIVLSLIFLPPLGIYLAFHWQILPTKTLLIILGFLILLLILTLTFILQAPGERGQSGIVQSGVEYEVPNR